MPIGHRLKNAANLLMYSRISKNINTNFMNVKYNFHVIKGMVVVSTKYRIYQSALLSKKMMRDRVVNKEYCSEIIASQ